jgi:hypothetical protein
MNPRICVCCGEPIREGGNALSRNPNVCASCSSLADGMDAWESRLPGGVEAAVGLEPQPVPEPDLHPEATTLPA